MNWDRCVIRDESLKTHATLRYRGNSFLESEISCRELLRRERTRTRTRYGTRIKQSIHVRHRDEEKSGIVVGDHLSSSCTRVLLRWSVYYLKSLKEDWRKLIEQSDECNSKSAKNWITVQNWRVRIAIINTFSVRENSKNNHNFSKEI